jgi:uncharacterized protein (DUF3084 family)
MSTPADNLRAAADAVLAQNAALAARVAQVEGERDDLRSRLTVAERVIDSRNADVADLRRQLAEARKPKPSRWERFWNWCHEADTGGFA